MTSIAVRRSSSPSLFLTRSRETSRWSRSRDRITTFNDHYGTLNEPSTSNASQRSETIRSGVQSGPPYCEGMPPSLSSIAVFCGSSSGADPAFVVAARALGETLGKRGIRLVYGGGDVGLMRAIANATLANGGEVHGVITKALLDKEVGHSGLTSLEIVETMHERKAAMADAAEAFIMLPGGYGTLDEFFEALTWTQLGIHSKPCGVLDVNDYFAPLRALFDTAVENRFIHAEHRSMVLFDTEPGQLIDRLGSWTGPDVDKWVDRKDR